MGALGGDVDNLRSLVKSTMVSYKREGLADFLRGDRKVKSFILCLYKGELEVKMKIQCF